MSKDKSPVMTFGAILVALGGILFYIKISAEWNGAVATATVTSIRERSETDSTGTKTYYEPAVWFVTNTGDTVKGFIDNDNENVSRYKIGQKMSMVYKHDDVNRCHEETSFLWYFLFVAVMLSGVAVMYFSFKLKSEGWN